MSHSKDSSSIMVVVRVRGSVVLGVRTTSFIIHESHPGVVLLPNVPTKMYCCILLRTTNKSGGGRATAGERRRVSKKVIRTGSGISYVQRRAERSNIKHSNQIRYGTNRTWYSCVV